MNENIDEINQEPLSNEEMFRILCGTIPLTLIVAQLFTTGFVKTTSTVVASSISFLTICSAVDILVTAAIYALTMSILFAKGRMSVAKSIFVVVTIIKLVQYVFLARFIMSLAPIMALEALICLGITKFAWWATTNNKNEETDKKQENTTEQ